MLEFDNIISLGSNCRTAFNLRRHYDFGKAYPFDWWITPLPGLIQALDDILLSREDLFFERDLLEEYCKDGKRETIVNSRYGIRMPHDFPKFPSGISDDWFEHVERPAARARKLMGDLKSLRGKTAFFYNFGYFASKGCEAEEQNLLDRLQSFSEDFILVLINSDTSFDDERIVPLRFSDPIAGDWRGDGAVWSEALNGLGLRLADEQRKRFVEGARPIAADFAEI